MNLGKIVLVVTGCASLGLGAVGAVLPVLPTVPFLLLAAFCFGKSSSRLNTWFLGTRIYKNNLESYARGEGMTRAAKLRIITLVSLLMGIGFMLMAGVPIGRMVLVCVWIGHIVYFVFCVKSR